MNVAISERKNLTFAQAEGVEPLPSQLKIKDISQELRALLWYLVHTSIETCITSEYMSRHYYLNGDWKDILYDKHIFYDHRMVDEFINDYNILTNEVKNIICSGNYIKIFGFLEFVLRHRSCPQEIKNHLNNALEKARAAYRVFDEDTIMPISSEAEVVTLQQAFADLNKTEFNGARGHLRNAGEALTAGNFSDSIRESIHSVESVARMLTEKNTFGEAIKELEKKFSIHTALKEGFLKIYGYTSDEKGVRHPSLNSKEVNVDETDALFMLGACASFVSYLINKSRTFGII